MSTGEREKKIYATARAWTIICELALNALNMDAIKYNDCHLNEKDCSTVRYAPAVLRFYFLVSTVAFVRAAAASLCRCYMAIHVIYVLFAFKSVVATEYHKKKEENRITTSVR